MADWNSFIAAKTTGTLIDDLKSFWNAQGAYVPVLPRDSLADIISKELLSVGSNADKQMAFYRLIFPAQQDLTLADYQQRTAVIG